MKEGSIRRLRVGIDAHALGSSLGGNATYAVDLLSGLAARPAHDYFIYVSDKAAAELARQCCPAAAAIRLIGSTNPLVRLGWRLGALCRDDRVDVLHVQYVAPVVSPPIVATIHDLSFLHHPEWFTRRERLQFKATIPFTAGRARRVITISEYSRADLVRTLKLPPEKVSYSHLALRSLFRPATDEGVRAAVLERLGISGRYVLAVGNLQPRKNLVRLLTAWAQLRRRHSSFDLRLVLVGRHAWRFDEIIRAATENEFAKDVHLTGYVDDADLPVLYSGAEMFVYPSLFEGFGYPPLEAMGCGAPVVTSRVTSLPEVCGDAAEYANPENVDEIAAAMLRLHEDAELRADLRRRGLERAERFRVNRVAETAVAAYEQAVGEGAR
jgi:glycosyltransferase involved in cell wall biosynthesis